MDNKQVILAFILAAILVAVFNEKVEPWIVETLCENILICE